MPCELFLTAVVPDDRVNTARAILSGVTEMRERRRFTAVCYIHREDSAAPKTLDRLKELQKERGSPNAARWQELHQILLKQSYVLQERVDITQEASNPTAGELVSIAGTNKPRLLRWNDFPEPPTTRIPEFVTQRRMLEISDRRLEKILTDTRLITRSASVEESYHWWLNNVEYELARYFHVPPQTPPGQVPNPATLDPVAPFWILYVRVQTETSAERIQQGYTQLVRVREDLLRVFDFKVFDRRAHETRNMETRT